MSIRKYVHQVRPIQEGFLEPAIKIQKFLSYLSEATMSIAQLKKRDNLNVLKDLIDNKLLNFETEGSRGLDPGFEYQLGIGYDFGKRYRIESSYTKSISNFEVPT